MVNVLQCDQEYRTYLFMLLTALQIVPPVVGKGYKMEHHFKKCPAVIPSVRQSIIAELDAFKENNAPSNQTPSSTGNGQPYTPSPSTGTPATFTFSMPTVPLSTASTTLSRPLKRSRTLDTMGTSPGPHIDWSAAHQQEFCEDLCKVFVSCGIAWNVLSDAELQLFVNKWIPRAKLPDRRALSGVFLDREVAKAEARTREKVEGELGTGQCDGWKNVSKTPVITSMMRVQREVSDMLRNAEF